VSKLKVQMTGPGMGHIELDGRDISMDVVGLTINLEVGRDNICVVGFRCEEFEVEGEFHVTHTCGLLSLAEGD
jgi:hypothetical protein